MTGKLGRLLKYLNDLMFYLVEKDQVKIFVFCLANAIIPRFFFFKKNDNS